MHDSLALHKKFSYVQMNSNDIKTEDNVQNGVSPMLRAGYSFPGQSDGSSMDGVISVTSTPAHDDFASPSFSRKELLLWMEDYKCSICGIEMPPDFVEERQEHFDFHLAEKLQKEESGIDSRTSMLRQRYPIFSFSLVTFGYTH